MCLLPKAINYRVNCATIAMKSASSPHKMISLKQLNTFGIDCYTDRLIKIQKQADLQTSNLRGEDYLILGGGSNVLFTDKQTPTILLMDNQGIKYQQFGSSIHVTAQAGVNWHQLVDDTLRQGFSGLENLALIPGNVGAAPIQNIGAYGVELCDRFISLTAWDFDSQSFVTFEPDDCQFDYRNSYFKSKEGRRFCIWDITLHLDSSFDPVLNYHGLTELADEPDLTAQRVFDTVCQLRKSKLPDPASIGNAGSFFKNPIIDQEHYDELKRRNQDIVAYPQPGKYWKLAAAWLIDQAGYKGITMGNAGVHNKQALVLVNRGNAAGTEIAHLAQKIQRSVFDKFMIKLEAEVNIITQSGRSELEKIS